MWILAKVSGARRRTRLLSLPPAATSPQKARRFATALLDEWDLVTLSGSVEFIVSELVTNAALHAHTDIEVLLTHITTGVRVEVRDRDSGGVLVPIALPTPAPSVLDAANDPDNPGSPDDLDALEALLTAEATTGRGLRLVAGSRPTGGWTGCRPARRSGPRSATTAAPARRSRTCAPATWRAPRRVGSSG
ncbi:MAG: ATP-binding protein [Frankiaceae bacterium]